MERDKPIIGIVIMIVAMAFFATKDGYAKIIVAYVPPLQLIWLQFLFTFLIIGLATVPRYGWRCLIPTPFGLQIFRGLASFLVVATLYWSLIYIPLADASAMVLISPIIVTGLSPLLLKEKIGFRRFSAVLIGFIGVIIILRPGFRGNIEGYLIGLLSGIFSALNYLGNRRLRSFHPPLVNIAHSVLIGIVFFAPIIPLIWEPIPQEQNMNFVPFLALSLIAHSLLVTAFIFGPASAIAPFQHSLIIFATIVGAVLFGVLPDSLTWFGISLIVGAGVYIAVREQVISNRSKG